MLNGENMEDFINHNIRGLYFNEIYLLTIYFYESVILINLNLLDYQSRKRKIYKR